MRRLTAAAFSAAALLLAACSRPNSALDPHGHNADILAVIIWIFTAVCTAVWIAVMIALALALLRSGSTPPPGDPLQPEPDKDRSAARVVAAAVGLTAVIILALVGVSYYGQRAVFASEAEPLSIRITGRQWWWQVEYEHASADQRFTTANEIHVPVGRPVLLKLNSSDVIHSFWVPSLTGKMDLVTGRENLLRIEAERPGVYRGQCAEYCGLQHAHMAILVVADPPEAFEAWRAGQVAAAAEPEDPLRKQGRDAFLSGPCVMCHAIRGTNAGGHVAPDLTHVGSRRTIAAGVLPRSRGSLAAWLVDPQGIKPGAHMPLMKLEPGEANAIAAYLDGLK